jgi:hypothetical protein
VVRSIARELLQPREIEAARSAARVICICFR